MESWEAGGRGRRLPLWVGQLYGPPEGHPAPRDVAGRTASDQQADMDYAAPHCSRLRGVGRGGSSAHSILIENDNAELARKGTNEQQRQQQLACSRPPRDRAGSCGGTCDGQVGVRIHPACALSKQDVRTETEPAEPFPARSTQECGRAVFTDVGAAASQLHCYAHIGSDQVPWFFIRTSFIIL